MPCIDQSKPTPAQGPSPSEVDDRPEAKRAKPEPEAAQQGSRGQQDDSASCEPADISSATEQSLGAITSSGGVATTSTVASRPEGAESGGGLLKEGISSERKSRKRKRDDTTGMQIVCK